VYEPDVRLVNRRRFELELEFVQALGNPHYLHTLAQQNILDQPAFIEYLKYLTYWKQREYARFLHYPHALHHLELLQHEAFRQGLKQDRWRDFIVSQQRNYWKTWREEAPHVSRTVDQTQDMSVDIFEKNPLKTSPT